MRYELSDVEWDVIKPMLPYKPRGVPCDTHGLPLELILTPGQAADCRTAAKLLGRLRGGTILLADQAYDADRLRHSIETAGAAPNIPSKITRRWRACFSAVLYRERNRVERFFNTMKHCRRIATRYEKHASNFLAMLKLAAVRLRLRHYESMTWSLLRAKRASPLRAPTANSR